MYGANDDIIELLKEKDTAIALLLEVAEGKKTKEDIQTFLEKNYPQRCFVEKKERKW